MALLVHIEEENNLISKQTNKKQIDCCNRIIGLDIFHGIGLLAINMV